MKTTIISLHGSPSESLFQLGKAEKNSFLRLEERVSKLLSTNRFLQQGHELLHRARLIFKPTESNFFDECLNAYTEGMGIDPKRYQSFLSLFELAAHHGQTYPELKSILPGCTSIFSKEGDNILHSRLLDFPLIGIYDKSPRLYYWKMPNKAPVLSYSCEGLPLLFMQGLHGSGMSFALHHKPGKSYHRQGQSIFQIMFELMFETSNYVEFRKELKKKISITKWSIHILDKSGQALVVDLDGPAQNTENYDLSESKNLIFTNIPLLKESSGFESYLRFSEERQNWLKGKLPAKDLHQLDMLTDVDAKNDRSFKLPAATLSTIAGYQVNLSQGLLDVKEGDGALTRSDAIIRFNLSAQNEASILKDKENESDFEKAWKSAAVAQGHFDQGQYDEAYHYLQMAIALMPHPTWKTIFSFYLAVWDFRFISNNRELSVIYKNVKGLTVPEILKDQWILLIMRLEKTLDLSPTVNFQDVSSPLRSHFKDEKLAAKPLFATWMKLLYPRLDILDVLAPYHKD
jgi:hypothetical protein